MVLITFATICTCIFFTLASAQLKGYPNESNVSEGTWARFSCTIKTPGTIMWRIGAHTDEYGYNYHEINQLIYIEGLRAQLDSFKVAGRKVTETIRILATRDLNGTAVECMYKSIQKKKHHEYSPFALLIVEPSSLNNAEEGEAENILKSPHSGLNREPLTT